MDGIQSLVLTIWNKNNLIDFADTWPLNVPITIEFPKKINCVQKTICFFFEEYLFFEEEHIINQNIFQEKFSIREKLK